METLDRLEAIRRKLDAAFERFLEVYARFGGHRYHGWRDYGDPENYKGPMFWSESDCLFRLAIELEREFPNQVHLELPVVRWSFAEYDPQKHQFLDLVISDMTDFPENDTSDLQFREHRHDLFLEAKYFPAGCSKGPWMFDHIRKVDYVTSDVERLALHAERNHCLVAAVLVVDDDDLFEDNRPTGWPSFVQTLVASPRELGRRGIPVN